jgi:hypothetical protein
MLRFVWPILHDPQTSKAQSGAQLPEQRILFLSHL